MNHEQIVYLSQFLQQSTLILLLAVFLGRSLDLLFKRVGTGQRVYWRLKCARVYNQMANLAPKKNNYGPNGSIVEERPSLKVQQVSQSREQAAATPLKRAHSSLIDNMVTIKRQQQSQGGRSLFVSTLSYRLDYMNMISYGKNKIIPDDGKLCNLLTVPSQKFKNGRKVKCKCAKSKCQSRYCQCFSRGGICGVDCECSNCHNLIPHEGKNQHGDQRGCHCSKSRCLKNYCECFQLGQQCSDKCQCTNCGNIKL